MIHVFDITKLPSAVVKVDLISYEFDVFCGMGELVVTDTLSAFLEHTTTR